MGWLVGKNEFNRLVSRFGRLSNRFTLIFSRIKILEEEVYRLNGKIAALEATHHKVGYVPVDAFKALSDGDIEQMTQVSEKVRDQLKEIVALNEQLAAAGDPGVGLADL